MFAISGMVAFLLFLVGDLNDAFWQRRILKPAFIAGFLTLVLSTVGCVIQTHPTSLVWWNLAFLAAAVLFTALLIWSLFFSFPPKETYIEASHQRAACTTGMYGLCRHPGVLWFCLLYSCLIPGIRFPAELSLLYCILNILLAWIEDRWIFPILFYNYRDYKQQSPFLIPTADSFRTWIHSIDRRS